MSRIFLSCLAALVASAPSLAAQQQGAVYATDRFGQHVDANYFLRPGNVYLVGGPQAGQPCSASGLADGDWYFALTTPDGSQLLSPDPIEDRRVRVIGGVIAQYLGTTHLSGGAGPCGSIFVQAQPFATSPSTDHESKVWMTRVEDFDTGGAGFFGFQPSKSKSESFKVRAAGPVVAQSLIRGRAFYDFDESGAWNPLTEPLEVPISGWRVEILQNDVIHGVTYTDQDGWYTFIRPRDGSTWTLREKAPGGYVGDAIPGATWVATTPRTGQVVAGAEQVAGLDFGNVQYEISAGAGRTVEFWSSQGGPQQSPGAPIMQASDPLWRIELNTHGGAPVNLRNPVSNDNPNASIFTLSMPPQSFDGAFANWKSFVNKTSHDHAGFLLSRQVGATILNNKIGFMQGHILVDRFQDGVLVPLEDILTGAIGLLSQVGAGLTGPNDPYQDLRHMMIMCTNEFSSINDTGDLAAPQVVYRRAMQPGVSSIFPYGD